MSSFIGRIIAYAHKSGISLSLGIAFAGMLCVLVVLSAVLVFTRFKRKEDNMCRRPGFKTPPKPKSKIRIATPYIELGVATPTISVVIGSGIKHIGVSPKYHSETEPDGEKRQLEVVPIDFNGCDSTEDESAQSVSEGESQTTITLTAAAAAATEEEEEEEEKVMEESNNSSDERSIEETTAAQEEEQLPENEETSTTNTTATDSVEAIKTKTEIEPEMSNSVTPNKQSVKQESKVDVLQREVLKEDPPVLYCMVMVLMAVLALPIFD